MKFLIVIILLACAGCAPLGKSAVTDDNYRLAAMSWVGADIQEMLAAWPNPNRKCGSNRQVEARCARWKHTGGTAGYWGSAVSHDCDTVAHYDVAGTVTDIDVNESRRCDDRYGEQLVVMNRGPTSP